MEAIKSKASQNIKLAIGLVALNIIDAVLTLAVVGKGYELNPVMRYLLEQPVWAFWVFKVGFALVFAVVLVRLSDRFPRQVKRILTILVVAMVGVCLFNMIGLFVWGYSLITY